MRSQKCVSFASGMFLFIALLLQSGCHSSGNSYTLYRSSPLDEHARIHVATFDAADGHDFNMTNCMIAKDLFQKQDGVLSKFWCEKGIYKK